jgi:hypothetical protein
MCRGAGLLPRLAHAVPKPAARPANDIGVHVALGWEYRSRRVEQGAQRGRTRPAALA